MYSVVLLAAMTGAAPGCPCAWTPGVCCPVSYGCCGVVQFFWAAPAGAGSISAKDLARWNQYLAALDEPQRSEMDDLWKKSDTAGRQKLLAQLTGFRPGARVTDPEPDRTVRRPARPPQPATSLAAGKEFIPDRRFR